MSSAPARPRVGPPGASSSAVVVIVVVDGPLGASVGGSASATESPLPSRSSATRRRADAHTSWLDPSRRRRRLRRPWASHFGDLDIVRELMDRGADVDAHDTNGCTALYFACEGGRLAVVRELLDRGADVNDVADLTTKRR